MGAIDLDIAPAIGQLSSKIFKSLLSLLSAHFEHHRFLLGSVVSLADFALMEPFCAYLSFEPIPSFMVETTAILV